MAAAATGATPATARKTLFTTTSTLLSSSLARTQRKLSCSAATADAPRIAPHPPDLVRWVQREGGFIHPALCVANHQEYGLGVSTGAIEGDIPPGELLIALPGRLPLRLRRPTSAADDVLLQLAKQVRGKALPDLIASVITLKRRIGQMLVVVTYELWAMKLGLRLLQERAKPDSFWWPYIANLPEAFTVPIFFPGEDIKNLQYAPVLHQVNKRCRFLLEFEREVCLGGPEIVDGRLLAALRVLLAADSEAMHKHDLKTLMSLDAEAPLGPIVEASALRTVLALCAIALQHFHTKIMEEDEAILKGEPPLTTYRIGRPV
ncbi:hypothetical protein PR202_gb09734 [Eleusine coracana subsp. coracana]|uniref:Rubisco LSMT substrate-binding domain-containing protein n=1 Tax=Eleusine coracana subsp. coracana TaxID=191504 RepID=A0AAV5EHG4_ELECO|nr:hypothetical protein PR202_gb09734 [Eleusine coracana subsp. coracana]